LAALRQARDAALRDEPGAADRLARALKAWRQYQREVADAEALRH